MQTIDSQPAASDVTKQRTSSESAGQSLIRLYPAQSKKSKAIQRGRSFLISPPHRVTATYTHRQQQNAVPPRSTSVAMLYFTRSSAILWMPVFSTASVRASVCVGMCVCVCARVSCVCCEQLEASTERSQRHTSTHTHKHPSHLCSGH